MTVIKFMFINSTIKNRGFTLIELLLTITVSSLIAFGIYMTFITVMRLWCKYDYRRNADSMVFLVYYKLDNVIKKSSRVVKMPGENGWLAYNSGTDSIKITYENDSLFFNEYPFSLNGCRLNYFKLSSSADDAMSDIWECAVSCTFKDVTSSLVWRTICMSDSIPETLPEVKRPVLVQEELYWEQKG